MIDSITKTNETGYRDLRRTVMDYIIVETIIISVGLAISVIKALQLIVSEIAEDLGVMFDTQS